MFPKSFHLFLREIIVDLLGQKRLSLKDLLEFRHIINFMIKIAFHGQLVSSNKTKISLGLELSLCSILDFDLTQAIFYSSINFSSLCLEWQNISHINYFNPKSFTKAISSQFLSFIASLYFNPW